MGRRGCPKSEVEQFCRPSSPASVLKIMSSSLRRKLSMTISKSDRKNSTFKVVILGQAAVGKTALTVRFMTRRFIWDYDPNLESKYSFASTVDGEPVLFEIIDTAGQDEGSTRVEENIKWADAFILVYSVTDSGSLYSCDRYKFLVNNYARRKKKSAPSGIGSGASSSSAPAASEWPVALVGNKSDLAHERCVPHDVGERAARQLGCTHFHDISVRESYDDAKKVFDDLYRHFKNPRAPARRTASSDATAAASANTVQQKQQQQQQLLLQPLHLRDDASGGTPRALAPPLPSPPHPTLQSPPHPPPPDVARQRRSGHGCGPAADEIAHSQKALKAAEVATEVASARSANDLCSPQPDLPPQTRPSARPRMRGRSTFVDGAVLPGGGGGLYCYHAPVTRYASSDSVARRCDVVTYDGSGGGGGNSSPEDIAVCGSSGSGARPQQFFEALTRRKKGSAAASTAADQNAIQTAGRRGAGAPAPRLASSSIDLTFRLDCEEFV